jgi:hypothetical protein
MSYVWFRDNPDLAGISEQAAAELEVLSEQIDKSSAIGNHRDACGCDDPKCVILECNLACDTAETSEVVGWLFAKGWLAAPEEVVSAVPDPASAQLRTEIVQAVAKVLEDIVDQDEALEVVDKAVMPVVDELLARARYMREAAELLSRNVESLAADLDSASSSNETLLKLVKARDAQIAELTKPVAPEPKVCKCCEAAADETGFKRGGCAGSPTFPYGCGHSYHSHFSAYLDEIRAVSALNAARAEAEVPGE